MTKSMSYRDAGVDISRGNEAKNLIKKLVRRTFGRHVLSDIGHFGGLFEMPKGFRAPVLVSSTDGVGTKLRIAFMTGRHDTVGQDLVNHCVNDILACGASPLFFLDYLGLGRVENVVIQQIVEGLAKACRENGCALIGGETAQMPGFYAEGEYDMAGTIVGVVEKKRIITGKSIRSGDIMIGLPSTGLHTNGYSLARAVLLEKYRLEEQVPELGCTLAEEFLKVHKSYLKSVGAVLGKFPIKGISHITGGGMVENTERVLPKGLKMKIDWSAWEMPRVFELIHEIGNVAYPEMIRTFNLGVGLILIVSPQHADGVRRCLQSKKQSSFILGEIVK